MWRIALIVYKSALLSVLHVSSSRNNATTCFLRGKLLRLADGKDGSPMGVVRRGGVHIVCSTEAQWNYLPLVIVSHSRP